MQIGKRLAKERHGYMLLFEPSKTKTTGADRAAGFQINWSRMSSAIWHTIARCCAGPRDRPGDAPGGDPLWVSRLGLGMTPRAIHHVVKKRTSAAYKLGFGPHLFRDCAATTIATEDPDHVRIVMSVLGHSRLRTSEKAYNHAQSFKAAGMYQAYMLKLPTTLF